VFFLIESLRAGVDVARRAIAPGRLNLRPAIVEFRTQLPPGAPRLLLLHAISILPGTLTVEWDGAVLRVHVLDVHGPAMEELFHLESHVGSVLCREMQAWEEG
jgi:multicomponent Na+:H+ antiporter subunit E